MLWNEKMYPPPPLPTTHPHTHKESNKRREREREEKSYPTWLYEGGPKHAAAWPYFRAAILTPF